MKRLEKLWEKVNDFVVTCKWAPLLGIGLMVAWLLITLFATKVALVLMAVGVLALYSLLIYLCIRAFQRRKEAEAKMRDTKAEEKTNM